MRHSLSILALIAVLGSAAFSVAAQTAAPAPAPAPAPALPDNSAVVAAQGNLAIELMEKLAAGRGGADPVVSPSSLASAFGLVGVGADSAMRDAIVQALGFHTKDANSAFEALDKARKDLTANASGVFQSASEIVLAPGTEPTQLALAGIQTLNVPVEFADLSKPEEAAKVDAWVKQATQGAIPEILGGPLDKPSFVVLDALHFKGTWKTPFDPQLTMAVPFTSVDRKTENVQMMHLAEAERSYRSEGGFIGVDLPFEGDRFSLVVVTTTDKPAKLTDFAKAADWLTGAGFAPRKGDLALPRFAVSGQADLLPALDQLGLGKARRSPNALAGFAPGTTLSQVVQRAMIEVDETGAEAAAVTAVMGSRSLEQDDSLHMNVDKPFIFALRDRATGLLLVTGYVGHTPKEKTT